MVQVVGYFENNVTFTEGPFVAVQVNGWRIECEIRGGLCPALPDITIHRMLEKEKGKVPGKLTTLERLAPYIEWLNEQVKAGRIVPSGINWIAPEYENVGM